MAEWWETLGDQDYNNWQANKVRQNAMTQMEERLNPTPAPAPRKRNPFQRFVSAVGSKTGSVLDTVAERTFLEPAAEAGLKQVGNAANYWNKNVVASGAGLVEGVMGHTQPVKGEKGIGPLQFSPKNLPLAQFDRKTVLGGPAAWRRNYERERQDMTGAQKFVFETAGDPTVLVGSVGKFGGALAARLGIPALPKVFKGIQMAEELPGRVVGRVLSKAGTTAILGGTTAAGATYANGGDAQDVALAGAGGAGAGFLLGKAANKTILGKPATSRLVGQESNAARDIARVALGKSADALGISWDGNLDDPRVLSAFAVRVGRAQKGLDTLSHEETVLTKMLNLPTPAPGKPGKTYSNVLEKMSLGGKATPRQFIAGVGEMVGKNETGKLQKEININRARTGIEYTKTNAKGVKETKYWNPLNALDKVYEKAVDPLYNRANRIISPLILGTPGFPVGNVLENAERYGMVGGMREKDFIKKFATIRGVPTETFNTSQVDNPLLKMYGATKANLGPGFELPKTLQKIPGLAGEKHPLNLLTGRTWLNMSGDIGQSQARKFIAETFDKERAALAAKFPTLAADALDEAAMQRTQDTFTKVATRAIGETNADVIAKHIFPFWTYEKQRPGYLLRRAAEKPGLAAAFGRYQGATDRGNIRLTDELSINPTAGMVYGGPGMLFRPSYPSYSQGASGKLEKALDVLGRGGLYPAAPINAGISLFKAGAGQDPELGRLIPSVPRVPFQVLAKSGIPGVSDVAANALSSPVLRDRFWDYYVAKELAVMGVNPDEASPEQRRAAEKSVSGRLALQNESNFLRFRPAEEQQYRDQLLKEAIARGVPEDVARKQARGGNPLSAQDDQGRFILTDADRRAAYAENPNWEPWRQVSEPLKNKQEQRVLKATRAYFQALDNVDAQAQKELGEMYARQQNLSGKQLRAQRADIMQRAAARREQTKQIYEQQGALVSEEARQAFYTKGGRELPGLNPKDEAARGYYDIQPVVDQNTGEADWEGFFQQRQAYLANVSPENRTYILEDYPRKKFKDPVVAQGEAAREQDLALVRQYFDIPQYLGLDANTTTELKEAQKLYGALRARNPQASSQALYAVLSKQYPKATWLMSHGYPSKLANPKRKQFLADNPRLAEYFSDVPQSAIDNLKQSAYN